MPHSLVLEDIVAVEGRVEEVGDDGTLPVAREPLYMVLHGTGMTTESCSHNPSLNGGLISFGAEQRQTAGGTQPGCDEAPTPTLHVREPAHHSM